MEADAKPGCQVGCDLPSLVTVTNLADVAADVVVPAMRAAFKEGEVTSFELRFSDDAEGTWGSPSP